MADVLIQHECSACGAPWHGHPTVTEFDESGRVKAYMTACRGARCVRVRYLRETPALSDHQATPDQPGSERHA